MVLSNVHENIWQTEYAEIKLGLVYMAKCLENSHKLH